MVSHSMAKFVVGLYKARANPAFGHFLSFLNSEHCVRLDTSELKSILLNAGISHPLASKAACTGRIFPRRGAARRGAAKKRAAPRRVKV